MGKIGTHDPFSVGLFFLFYFVLSCWTYGLSISSGIFVPALLSGAAWGRLLGLALYHSSNQAVSCWKSKMAEKWRSLRNRIGAT